MDNMEFKELQKLNTNLKFIGSSLSTIATSLTVVSCVLVWLLFRSFFLWRLG
jgi:hypothetical protein